MAFDYDVIVIGGGVAGLTSAGMSAAFGAKTALIEKGRLGGQYTWYGSIPSKALAKSARIAFQVKSAFRFGLSSLQPEFDFEKIMERVHSIQFTIYEEANSPQIFEEIGVKIIQGNASFVNRHTIEILDERNNPTTLTSKYFVIATGSRPYIPEIKGINKIDFLTNETIFNIEELPQKLVIIGAGSSGIEMAQAFTRLGVKIIVIDSENNLIPREDKDFTPILRDILIKEGVEFKLGHKIERLEKSAGDILLHLTDKISGKRAVVEASNLLLAAGRQANYELLNLDAAGVGFSLDGININRHCRTSSRNIFACGDVTGVAFAANSAEHMAKVAVSKMLLKMPVKLDKKSLLRCTYTDPEIASVGLTHEQLIKKKMNFEVYKFPFTKIHRAVAESEIEGWIKIFAGKKSGKIFGATIIGVNAAEMICEYALAIKNNISLRKIYDTVHPPLSYTFGNRRIADIWLLRRQSSRLIKLIQKLFRYRGRVLNYTDLDNFFKSNRSH